MSSTEREVPRILSKKNALTQIWDRGYVWFRSCYLPALDCRSIIYPELESKELLAFGHFCAGDVHDLNGAPRAALREYYKSIALSETFGAPWCEAGCIYNRFGQFNKALHCFRRAVSIDPKDDSSRQELEFALDRNLRCPPIYRKGDIRIATNELLARGRPKSVLAKLKGVRSVIARQQCARAFGVLQDLAGVIREWERISRYEGTVDMDFADWFYIGQLVWDNQAFWKLMLRCVKRFYHYVDSAGSCGTWPYSIEPVKMTAPKCGVGKGRKQSDRLIQERHLRHLLTSNLARASECPKPSRPRWELAHFILIGLRNRDRLLP